MSRPSPTTVRSLACLAALIAACAKESAPPPQPAPGYGSYGQPGYGPPPPGAPQAPYYPPPSAPMPAPASPPTPPPAPAATATPLPMPPFGSYDAGGSFTAQFVRQEPLSVQAELTAALPADARAKVQGVPLKIVEDPKEVNAFAGCTDAGSPYVAVTVPLLLIVARTSEVRAFDEIAGSSKYNDLANGLASEVKAQKAISGPGFGFLPLPLALDPRKLARQKILFDEQLAFIVGHELSHHHRGHTGCANGANTSAITPRDVGRLLSGAVPIFNQPNEIEADIQGTFNLLDTGSHRQGGAWSEEGAIMTLDFFSRLQSLGVETVVLGFLMTHPAPQFRLPIVTTAAQQWRNNGGRAPAFPFQLPF